MRCAVLLPPELQDQVVFDGFHRVVSDRLVAPYRAREPHPVREADRKQPISAADLCAFDQSVGVEAADAVGLLVAALVVTAGASVVVNESTAPKRLAIEF